MIGTREEVVSALARADGATPPAGERTEAARQRVPRLALVVAIAAVSVAAWIVTYRHGLVLAYNDSLSHLDIARQVVDSQQPGMAQLGGVWLPLNQLLYLPLVWNNWAWHTGFAGSLVSMAAYVCTVLAAYGTVVEITGSRLAAAVGALALALNPNFLYLQSTPLTEPVFLALLALSSLYLVRYLKTHEPGQLVLLSLVTALAVEARYDGWFLAAVEVAIIAAYELGVRRLSRGDAFGIVALYTTPVALAMGLWLLWNLVLFGSPLYSFVGPYSAHAQQTGLQAQHALITKSNLWESIRAYALDSRDNVGALVGGVGVLGWAAYLVLGRDRAWFKAALLVFFTSEAVFNILALYLGFSILNVPALHWNPGHAASGRYFNVRYGITALPLIAAGCGLLVSVAATGLRRHRRRRQLRRGLLAGVVSIGILAQAAVIVHDVPITVVDGTVGSSAFAGYDIAHALHRLVRGRQDVVLSESYYNGVMLRSGLDMRHFIYEGIRRKWKAAIGDPYRYAEWVVMANSNVGEPVYTSLMDRERGAFLADYRLAYAGRHADIYQRKTPYQMFITASGSRLLDGTSTFRVRGVDSYDLAYQSDASIAATFRELSAAGVNTVRFWLFGDGFARGFQPRSGIINPARMRTTDFILAEAHRYRIRLIPTLTNNWPVYGGMDQYLAWSGLPRSDHDAFYTDPAVIRLYENYVAHILTRVNSITGVPYADDPAILAWDLANEPRVARAGDLGEIATWANRVSRWVHSIDRNHLITIGLDGDVLADEERAICQSPTIGLCSIHLYPNVVPSSKPGVPVEHAEGRTIDAYQRVARAVHRPILVSEVGISKRSSPDGGGPLDALRATTAYVATHGYSGWLIWNWSQRPDTSFGFSPSGLHGVYSLRELRQVIAASRAPGHDRARR